MPLLLTDVAEFTWDFGMHFFLETATGNYIWSDPAYGGDNTIKGTNQTYKQFIKGRFGRSKGKHTISGYCGDKVVIIEYKN